MASLTTHGVHMNGGEGDTSYAKNSTPQRRVQQRLTQLVEAAVMDLWAGTAATLPPSIGIADLGCSSGPNTLFLVTVAIDAVRHRCAAAGSPCPEFRVYLNDLPDNDFNAVFRQLPAFLQRQPEPSDQPGNVFIFGAPGGNICAGRTSSPAVIYAYARQFSTDLTLFLSSRAVEVVAGGWVLVSIKGRSTRDMSSEGCAMNDHPNRVLNDMAAQGLVDAEKLESYNTPVYDPCAEEMREIVDAEGSFEIVNMESYETAVAGSSTLTPAGFARTMRAVHESMLARHFGPDGIDMADFVRTAEAHFDRLIREGTYRGALMHLLSLKRKCKC
ncbi:hypothetical protein QOZ80_4AG0316370 [Eleusine coracana subsp. coracana]|nr:hypothetical protein QOZ80_4AG0316370 [Eleusine coracana subsp. coracana]